MQHPSDTTPITPAPVDALAIVGNDLEAPVEGKPDYRPPDDVQELSPEEKALIEASEKGDLEKVKQLVGQGVNINCFDSDETLPYPVLVAAWYGHYEILKFLVNEKADLCFTDFTKENIFDQILDPSKTDNPEIIDFLMRALATNSQDWEFYSEKLWWAKAILKAAQQGKDDSLKILLQHLKVYCENNIKTEQEKLKYTESYLKYHPDYFKRNIDRTACPILLVVCESPHIKQGHRLLIEAGADIQSCDLKGNDVLYHCVEKTGKASEPPSLSVIQDLIGFIKNNTEYFKTYRSRGGFVEALKCHLRFSAFQLQENAAKQFQDLLEILFKELEDDSGSVDLYRSITNIKDPVGNSSIENLYESDPSKDPVFATLKYIIWFEKDSLIGPQVLRYLIRHGAAIDRLVGGKKPLEYAKESLLKFDSLIKKLAEGGQVLTEQAKSTLKQNLQTAIGYLENAEKFMALCKGNLDMEKEQALATLKTLVDAGVSVNQVDRDNKTPLYHAVENGQEALVEKLLNLGANPHYHCCSDVSPPVVPLKTPFQLACVLAQTSSRGQIYLTLIEKIICPETAGIELEPPLLKWSKIIAYLNKDVKDNNLKCLMYFIVGKKLKYEIAPDCGAQDKHSVHYLSFKLFTQVHVTSQWFKEANFEIAGLLMGGCLALDAQDNVVESLVVQPCEEGLIASLDPKLQSSDDDRKLALDVTNPPVPGDEPRSITQQRLRLAFRYANRAGNCHDEARLLRNHIINNMMGLNYGDPDGVPSELFGENLTEFLLIKMMKLQDGNKKLQDGNKALESKVRELEGKCKALESTATSSTMRLSSPTPPAMVPQFDETRQGKKRKDRDDESPPSETNKYSCSTLSLGT